MTPEQLALSDLALIEACDSRFGSMTLYGRGSVHLILEQLKSYVKEGETSMEVTGWQPIETAPKDDTNVLLWWPFWVKNRPTIGWFGHRGIQQWVCPEACEGDGDPPTHWMPLPVPPQVHP